MSVDKFIRNQKYYYECYRGAYKVLTYLGTKTYGYSGVLWYTFCESDDLTQTIYLEFTKSDGPVIDNVITENEYLIRTIH